MQIQDINNYFGDMDLFLMDLVLKGTVSFPSKVLDVGCGEGRNGIYFIQNGYEYLGIDIDRSKLSLIQYLSENLPDSKAKFKNVDLRDSDSQDEFDLIICSRVLHFAKSEEDLKEMWRILNMSLKTDGILYIAMDSIVDTTMGRNLENGLVEFPDKKVRFALTQETYQDLKKGFKEIEPLRTLVHQNMHAQSFMCLKKI
ncbi:class I SAM-dependent methyltransferase [Ekhidna sp.]